MVQVLNPLSLASEVWLQRFLPQLGPCGHVWISLYTTVRVCAVFFYPPFIDTRLTRE